MKAGFAAAMALISVTATAQDRAATTATPPQNAASPPVTTAKPPANPTNPTAKPPLILSPAQEAARAARSGAGVTPNEQRTVTIGALNKRTGENRTFVGKPGQMFDFGSLHVIVRTCETTPPWEQKLTGAFLLIDERLLRGGAKRVFSGWMFAESPSLHPLEHPRYDIWVKSCTMRFPETGPDTVVVGKPSSPVPATPSSAKKSAETSNAVAN